MTVRYTLDSSGPDRHMSNKAKGLDADTILALESALVAIFQATQAAVHVHSGRLRSSGRFSSKADHDSWEGEILYGGKQFGVEYAWYEQRRGHRDGVNHDFMDIAQNSDEVIGTAFRTGLD